MELKDPKLFRQQCYVNGEWVDADDRATIPVKDPASGEVLGTVPKMGAEETRRAIEAANKALPAWRAKTAKERAQILRRWYDLMMANQEDLATLMTAEQRWLCASWPSAPAYRKGCFPASPVRRTRSAAS